MRTPIQPILVGLATLAAVGFGAYLLLAAFIDKLNSIDGDLGKTLITAAVTMLVAVITLVLGKVWDTKIKIRQDIRDKKIPVYEDVLTLFFDILMSDKAGKARPTEPEMIARFTDFTRRLTIWGSSAVIQAWLAFRNHPWSSDAVGGMHRMDSVLLAMRRDVGNDVKELQNHDLMRLFVNDFDAHTQGQDSTTPTI